MWAFSGQVSSTIFWKVENMLKKGNWYITGKSGNWINLRIILYLNANK